MIPKCTFRFTEKEVLVMMDFRNKKGGFLSKFFVFLLIFLIMMSVMLIMLGKIPGLGKNAAIRNSQEYWASQGLSIVSYHVRSNGNFSFLLKNNYQNPVLITSIQVYKYTFNTSISMDSGDSELYSNITASHCLAEWGYSYPIVIKYVDKNTGSAFSMSSKLEGICSG